MGVIYTAALTLIAVILMTFLWVMIDDPAPGFPWRSAGVVFLVALGPGLWALTAAAAFRFGPQRVPRAFGLFTIFAALWCVGAGWFLMEMA